MGAHKQIGQCDQRMAPGAMPGGIRVHSRRLEQTPAAELSLGFQPQCGKVRAEVPNCILTCPWGSSQGYCYLSALCLCSALASALGQPW